MDNTIIKKKCSKCGKEFSKNKSKKNSYNSWCKSCVKKLEHIFQVEKINYGISNNPL